MAPAKPATIGVLTEPFLYEWHVRAIERLRAELDVEIPLVVWNARNTEYEAESWNTKNRIEMDDVVQFFDVFRQQKAWALVLAERTVGRILGDKRTLWHRHSLENVECLADAEHVRCNPEKDDGWIEFPDDVVARIAERCDAVILFGFGLVRGELLNAPEYGVLNVHPADIRKYRGLGPETVFYDGRERAGATVQRLSETVDGGEIIAFDEIDVGDCYTLWDLWEAIVTLQVRLLTEGVANLRDPAFEPTTVPEAQLGEFYYRSHRHSLDFAGRTLMKNLSGRVRRQLYAGPTASLRR
ncbi:formyltransferase family protein [Natronococcus wangiae]|uniref:formyltransferase family protein n=1 Tax=Natronococcus wangiae TaxID=3068275 RepID=UPI00273D7B5C|nr:formyltransferase family protein [Natronococcus sp. AD5]